MQFQFNQGQQRQKDPLCPDARSVLSKLMSTGNYNNEWEVISMILIQHGIMYHGTSVEPEEAVVVKEEKDE